MSELAAGAEYHPQPSLEETQGERSDRVERTPLPQQPDLALPKITLPNRSLLRPNPHRRKRLHTRRYPPCSRRG
jgi:hypothetical protein